MAVLPSTTFDEQTPKQQWQFFEDATFKVVGFFMSLFCHPDAASFCSDTNSAAPMHKRLVAWLPARPFVLRTIELRDPNAHYHPFQLHTTHAAAAKGELVGELVALLKRLKRGSALWLYCGVVLRLTSFWLFGVSYATNFRSSCDLWTPSPQRRSLRLRKIGK